MVNKQYNIANNRDNFTVIVHFLFQAPIFSMANGQPNKQSFKYFIFIKANNRVAKSLISFQWNFNRWWKKIFHAPKSIGTHTGC